MGNIHQINKWQKNYDKKITQTHPIIDLTLLNVAQNKALVLKELKKSVHEHTISQKKEKKTEKISHSHGRPVA